MIFKINKSQIVRCTTMNCLDKTYQMMREIREGRHNWGLERRKKKHKLLEGAWNMKYIGRQDLHKAKQ